MSLLLQPVMWLAIAGFVASLLVHALALMGQPSPFGAATWMLHLGIFVVWLPAVLVAQRLSKNAKQAELWKAVLRGCPTWVKRGAYVVFAYALINFFLFMVQVSAYPRNGVPSALEFRGFSGHWMVFYYLAAATLYSYSKLANLGPRRCPHGHEVSPFARYCDACGAELPPAPIQ